MKLKHYLRRALSLPAHVLIMKSVERGLRSLRLTWRRQWDHRNSTYKDFLVSPHGELHSYLLPSSDNSIGVNIRTIAAVTEHYLVHRFSLLGSGWLEVRHGKSCRGVEGHHYEMGSEVHADSEGRWLEGRINRSNLATSQRIWRLVDKGYIPIDWHLDFKSGYRWAEDTWYLDIPYGHKRGVDVKVPWELARMQHLPQLALAYGLARRRHAGFEEPGVYEREFRNQVLDFIATNPPRFGVNWRSTMDVAIRVSNWLMAYDLFKANGAELDEIFEREFFLSIYTHGRHIVNNLEWSRDLRGNHYLSNVVGLLFVAAYLPCTPETDAWLAFSVQELVWEVEGEFTPDGANFEASTSYHRLSAEMVVYASALILGLSEDKQDALKNDGHRSAGRFPRPKPGPIPLYPLAGSSRFSPFPAWYIERLEKMAEFTMHVTKPNRHIAQIGDNDSGRFMKLQPVFHPMAASEATERYTYLNGYSNLPGHDVHWDEDHLDHRHLVAAMNGLFKRSDFAEFAGEEWPDAEIIRQLAKGIHLPSYLPKDGLAAAERVGVGKRGNSASHQTGDENIRLYVYPDFGLYIYFSKDLYLVIRCGPIGQNGNGGHAHNDNLSFELNLNGRDFIVDGGSYLYTSAPEMRNAFRSTRCHNTVSSEGCEQNGWLEGLEGLFSMKDEAKAYLLDLTTECFEGEHSGFGRRHRRRFNREGRSLIIEDWIDGDGPFELNFNLAPEAEVVHIDKIGIEEFCLQIWIDDLRPQIILKGFDQVGTLEGFFSKGYGERVKNQLIRCYRSRNVTQVRIDFGLVSH